MVDCTRSALLCSLYWYICATFASSSFTDSFKFFLKSLIFLHYHYIIHCSKIYVTGHSLGASLSSILAFKLAGSKKHWIPKPITCISVESPLSGGTKFKTAFQKLESDGLLRYLRITNSRDIVPALPPFSLSIFKNRGLYQHVGIRLDFTDRDTFSVSYPHEGSSRFRRALSNTILKPVWSVLKYHGLDLVDERMRMHREDLSNMTINGIYQDESIVGSIAVAGRDRDEL